MSGHRQSIPWWIIGVGALLFGGGVWLGGNPEAGERALSAGVLWVAVAIGVHIGAAGGRFDRD